MVQVMKVVGSKKSQPSTLEEYLAEWSIEIPCWNSFCDTVLEITAADLRYLTKHNNTDLTCMIRCPVCRVDQLLYVTNSLPNEVIPAWVFSMLYDKLKKDLYIRVR